MSPPIAPEAPRRVLVTGASRGIGRATAIALAGAGFQVTVHYFRSEAGAVATQRACEDAGTPASLLCFDVADRGACAEALAKDLAAHGEYWGVVSNAGIHEDAAFPAMTAESWDRVLATNLDGFYNVVQPLVLPMVQGRRGGRIVTMSSVSGIMGNRGQVNYAASKAALIGATRSLAQELARRRITVNSVAPGLIETEMTEGTAAELTKQIVPMRRMGHPEEVAAVVAFLFSEGAGYLTGQVISVNGGMA